MKRHSGKADSGGTSASAHAKGDKRTSSARKHDGLLLKNVKELPLGPVWKKRFQEVGIDPKNVLLLDVPPPTKEQKEMFLAQRHYFMGCYYREQSQNGRALEEFQKSLDAVPDNAPVLIAAAQAELELKEMNDARAYVEKVLDEQSTNVAALQTMAQSYMIQAQNASGTERDKLVKNAISTYEKAKKQQPKNIDVLKGLAQAYVLQQNIDKIIRTYQEIVEVNPKDTYSLLILGQVLSRMDRNQEAVEYYQKVIDQRRGFIGGYIYLGQLYERMHRDKDALNLYKQALLVDPDNSEVLKRFEDLLRRTRGMDNKKGILDGYRQFAREYPYNTEVQKLYAERLADDKDWEGAIAQYKKVLAGDPENIDSLIALGKISMERKKYQDAVDYFSQAVEVNPDKPELYDAVAAALLGDKQTDKAEELYRKAIEKNPKTEKLYISLAALMEENGKIPDAIEVMKNAVANVGEKPELLAVLGKFYRKQGDDEKAEKALRKAYDQSPENLPLYAELVSLYVREGNTSEALHLVDNTSSGVGTTRDVVLSVGAEAFQIEGHTTEAISLYHKAIALNPDKFDYLSRIVEMNNLLGNHEKSLELIDEYGPKIKNDGKVDQLRAEIFLDEKKYDEAIGIYRKLLKSDPTDLDNYQLLIDAYNAAKRYSDSLDVVDKAEDQFGKSEPSTIELMRALVMYKAKRLHTAEGILRRLAAKNPRLDDTWYYLGSVYLDEEKYDSAEKALRKAIDLNPLNANALNALGFMFADQDEKLDEAHDLIQKALNLNPSAPHIMDSMGWVLFRQGKNREAAKWIEKAARIFPDPEVFEHLGDIYAAMDRKDDAVKAYRKVQTLDPDRKSVKKKLEKLEK